MLFSNLFTKKRLFYYVIIIVTVITGLSTRKFPGYFIPFIAEYGGDILYAALFFFLFRCAGISHPLWKIALFAYLYSVCIECLQLYHAPWIEKIRFTTVGGLILGYGFLWSDIACYATGVILGWLVAALAEKYLLRNHRLYGHSSDQ